MDAEYGQIAGEFMRGAAPISDRFRELEILVARATEPPGNSNALIPSVSQTANQSFPLPFAIQ
ncbi:uncharacterized protein TrAFT101_001983 [Trichoderma asperellum]|uniref:uncharacterized protein n=1 Tax=Trichoderma asperellum TaxID=101201 RepID=UPI00332D3B6E|nr:hypothetical protein TrAFT101_001983 [Trichoderma asperellum]